MSHGAVKGLKWLAGGLLAVVLVVAVLAWWGRDWPRLWLENGIVEEAGPRSSLGGVEVVDGHTVVLTDLRLARPTGFPWLQELFIGRLTVQGTLQGLFERHAEAVTVESCRMLVDVSMPIELPDTETPVRVDTLIVRRCAVDIESPTGPASMMVEGRFRDFGERLDGELFIAADDLPVGVLAALAGAGKEEAPLGGRILDLRADLRFEQPGDRRRMDVRASSVELSVEEVGVLRLDGPGVEVTMEESATVPGRFRVAVRPSTELFRQSSLSFVWDTGEASGVPPGWDALEMRIGGLDLGRLGADLQLVPEISAALGEWSGRKIQLGPDTVRGEADLEMVATPGSYSFQVEARVERWHGPFGVEVGSEEAPLDLRLRGALYGERLSDLSGQVEGELDLPSGPARIGSTVIPPALLPLALKVDGLVSVDSLTGARLTVSAGAFEPLRVAGDVTVEAEAPTVDLKWEWDGGRILELRSPAQVLGVDWPEVVQVEDGRVRLHGTARGSLPYPAAVVAVDVEGLDLSWSVDQVAEPLRVRLEAGSLEVASGSEWTVRTAPDGLDIAVDIPGVDEPLPLHIESAVAMPIDLASGRVEKLLVTSPEFGLAELTGTWRGRDPVAAEGTLRLSELPIPAWQDLLAVRLPVATDGYSTAGRVGADLVWQADLESGRWQAEGEASLHGVGFSSVDGSRVLEGFDSRSRWRLEGVGSEAGEGEIDVDIGGFVLLLGSFFGDASHLESRAEGRIFWPASTATSGGWRGELSWELPQGPWLEIEFGTKAAGLRTEGLDYRASLSIPDLAYTHKHYLAPVLGDLLPPVEVEGRLRATAEGRWLAEELWSSDLHLVLGDFGLRSETSDLTVRSLQLDLPVNLEWRSLDPGVYGGDVRAGRIRFDRLELFGIELSAGDIDLFTAGDSLRLEEAIDFPILGGRVALEQLILVDLLRPSGRLETGLDVRGLSLESLSAALDLLPLEGSLQASFPRVVLTPEKLLVDGGGEMEVFGGRVVLEEVSGSEVLSDYPTFLFSTRFTGIDLGQFTRRIDFGEISGLVEGYVRNCRLFQGVPVNCEAMMRTLKQRGVKRAVSVKAINNMTILGTGRGTGNIFDSGIRRFMDRFTYKRLGLTMELEDDVFLLRGLEKKGDLELFVKGRLPFPINIVNARPGQTVSFQTMLRRLQSLELGDATTGTGGR